MQMRFRKAVLAVLSLVLVLSLAACGSKPQEPAAAPAAAGDAAKVTGKVTIYTSIYPYIIKLVEPDLKKAFPDLTIEWFQSGTEKVIAKLAGEIEANKIGADILMVADPSYYIYLLMVADPSYYIYLKEKGLLLQYKPKDFDQIVVDKDPEGYYAGVRVSNVIIAWNTNLVSAAEAPKSFQELLDPKWKDQVVLVDPTQSGSALVTLQALVQKYGWEYFEKLKANGAVVGGGNSSVEKKLVAGEYKVAIILEENILKVKDRGEPVDFTYPTDGTIIIPSPIAIFKSSQNPEAAKAVTDWWLSAEGQQAVVKGWMHAVRADVSSPKGAKPLTSFAPGMPVDWQDLSKNMGPLKDQYVQLMGTR